MKAKLVYVSLVTRVIVEDDATEEEILEAARNRLSNKIWNELSQNVDEIMSDVECPYDPEFDD